MDDAKTAPEPAPEATPALDPKRPFGVAPGEAGRMHAALDIVLEDWCRHMVDKGATPRAALAAMIAVVMAHAVNRFGFSFSVEHARQAALFFQNRASVRQNQTKPNGKNPH